MDGERIIELCNARNEQAIRELEERFGRLCYGIAYRILGNREDAEECVNDTLHGVWNAIPPATPENLTAFVCKIARNQSLRRLEYQTSAKRSAEATVPIEELAEILPDERFAPDAEDGEVSRLIGIFLRKQKADMRNVFLRRYWFFDSVADIAKRYSFTESKVKNMLLRTRRKLKEYLVKEGVEI